MSDIVISGILLVKRNFNVSVVIRNVNHILQSWILIFRTKPVLELFLIHILLPLPPSINVAAFLFLFFRAITSCFSCIVNMNAGKRGKSVCPRL